MSGPETTAPARGEPLVILAGGGRFPFLVAEAALAAGRPVTVAALIGEADPAIAALPHRWIGRGQVTTFFRLARAVGARDMVFIGAIRQRRLPTFAEIDFGGIWNLLWNWRLLMRGDDGVLRRLARFFEANGLRVCGAAEIAPDLLVRAGAMGALAPAAADLADVALGLDAARALGRRDLGQAVIAADGRVVAEEDRRGTDAMVAAFGAPHSAAAARAGVLIKCPKPTQDRRLDMPAIGPDTVRTAAAAGLRGIAVEAGGTLVADRAEVVRLADALGLFVWGVAPSPEASP